MLTDHVHGRSLEFCAVRTGSTLLFLTASYILESGRSSEKRSDDEVEGMKFLISVFRSVLSDVVVHLSMCKPFHNSCSHSDLVASTNAAFGQVLLVGGHRPV